MLLLEILKRLDHTRFAPHLACTSGPLAERAAAADIPFHITPLPRLRRSFHTLRDLSAGIRALARTAREIEARLLIANTVRAAFYTAPAARLLSIPFIWYRHDFWLGEAPPRFPWLDTAIKAGLCAIARCVIANSHATAQRHPCQRKIIVVYNGIETRHFEPPWQAQLFRQTWKIPPDAPVVGMAGRLCAIKGQTRFLRVLAHILQSQPEVRGLVVGGPIFGETDYQVQLQQLTQELGIASRVVFTGQVNDPKPALAAMDVFIQPGDPEAFGLVNIEAMATAKPVIAFAHGALPEIVIDHETGLLIPPTDEVAMASAVSALLADPPRRIAMGKAGRARVEDCFTIERTARAIETVLEASLTNAHAA